MRSQNSAKNNNVRYLLWKYILIESLILNFLFLLLRVLFNPTPDVIYKHNKFFKIFEQKNLKFVVYKEISLFTFKLGFILLSINADFFSKK